MPIVLVYYIKPNFICRYEYINAFILDYISFSIHESSAGGYYWQILALQDLLKATEYIGASGNCLHILLKLPFLMLALMFTNILCIFFPTSFNNYNQVFTRSTIMWMEVWVQTTIESTFNSTHCNRNICTMPRTIQSILHRSLVP